MNQVAVRDSDIRGRVNTSGRFDRRALWKIVLLFVAAGIVFFLLNNRIVAPFDEGLLLTDAMRTAAGQVVHRDFNYYYGPAQLYLVAGLFKLFGPSVLAERIANTFFASVLVVTLYALSRRFCGRIPSLMAVTMGSLWLIDLMMLESTNIAAQCILTLWTSWLILPVTDERVQRRRALGAGLLAGMMFLFRYDKGLGIVAANLIATVIVNWMQPPRVRRSLKWLAAKVMGPYLTAFLVVIIPAVIAFLSVAPMHAFLEDAAYITKYYRAGRGLPFPALTLGPMFTEDPVYLLPIVLALGFVIAGCWLTSHKAKEDPRRRHRNG